MMSTYLYLICIILILSLIILSVSKMATSERNTIQQKNCDLYYFDNNATTDVYDREVLDEIIKWTSCGNPSNVLHCAGLASNKKITDCRKIIADDLRVKPDDIYFTSGATDSNNIVIQGIVYHYLEKSKSPITIITSNFEHPSVKNVFQHFSNNDKIEVIFVPIKANPKHKYYGCVDPSDVEKAINNANHKVILLSIMFANNETGAIQNIKEIGEIAKKHKIYFHSDVTQAIGKYIIHPNELNIDSLSFSGHKFHGPKGIGCLYMKKYCNELSPICFGGEQESSLRPGTENVAGIAGMTLALSKVHENRISKTEKLSSLRNYLKDELQKLNVICIEPVNVLPNTLLVILSDINICNKAFARELSDTYKICVGVSSACQTKHTSHVLDAMKIPEKEREKIIRISMSDITTHDQCSYLIKCLSELLRKHRS